jgi:glucose-fructose oxidoreductase
VDHFYSKLPENPTFSQNKPLLPMDSKQPLILSRRHFLSTSAVALASAIATPKILANAGQNRSLGVALVGLGYYSTDLLAPALQLTKNCHLAGIVTGSPEKAKAWKEKYGLKEKNIYNYQNFDSIKGNPDIDIVYVVLPPSMHKEYTVRAAKAGKHVFCEKPMALTSQECQDMIKACQDAKVSLAIGYRCQHDPNTRAYMDIAREQKLGKVKYISVAASYTEGRKGHWKMQKAVGGGSMYDMGVYALQGARLAAGEEPIAVSAQSIVNRPEIFNEADEMMMFQLKFPSGAVASCMGGHGANANYLKVNYEKGSLFMEPFSSYKGNKGTGTLGTINFTIENQQAKQMDDDALAIMNRTPLLVPGEEGLRDIKIVEAIYQAVKTGGQLKL